MKYLVPRGSGRPRQTLGKMKLTMQEILQSRPQSPRYLCPALVLGNVDSENEIGSSGGPVFIAHA